MIKWSCLEATQGYHALLWLQIAHSTAAKNLPCIMIFLFTHIHTHTHTHTSDFNKYTVCGLTFTTDVSIVPIIYCICYNSRKFSREECLQLGFMGQNKAAKMLVGVVRRREICKESSIFEVLPTKKIFFIRKCESAKFNIYPSCVYSISTHTVN